MMTNSMTCGLIAAAACTTMATANVSDELLCIDLSVTDQITILAPGEAVVVGSAFNVPTRAKIHMPDPAPASPTSSPYVAWAPGEDSFDLEQPLSTWSAGSDVPAQPDSSEEDTSDA